MNTTANVANIPVWQNKSIENLEGEVWVPLSWFPEKFAVSNMGRIKSVPRPGYNVSVILKQRKTPTRLAILISDDNKVFNFDIKNLVYTSFFGTVEKEYKIINIDTDNYNNQLSNLKKVLSINTIKGEIWKDIKGYEGIYQVSNKERIKSVGYTISCRNGVCMNIHDKILNQVLNEMGYFRVFLSKNNKVKTKKVHRLIANAFICNPKHYPVVNHINKIRTDNSIENLEWCTQKHNLRHSGIFQNQEKPVRQLSKSRELIAKYPSVLSVSENGFKKQGVSRCCNNHVDYYKGFIWEFVD